MENDKNNSKSAKIALGKGHFAIIDLEDLPRLCMFRWFFTTHVNTIYAQRYVDKSHTIFMHRQIMSAEEGQMLDHINGNGLDNKKKNLRFVTNSQNIQNSKKRKDCSSKYKGVDFNKNRWRSRIFVPVKKSVFIGYFDTEIQAANAYDEKAKNLFGEYARLNFPEKGQLVSVAENENRRCHPCPCLKQG